MVDTAAMDELRHRLHRIADRLLHNQQDVCGHALQTGGDVHLLRRGLNDAVRIVDLEQLGQRGVQRDVELGRDLRRRGKRIHDRADLGRRARVDLLAVPLTDQSRARHRDANSADSFQR